MCITIGEATFGYNGTASGAHQISSGRRRDDAGVPLLGELAQTGTIDPPLIARVEPHELGTGTFASSKASTRSSQVSRPDRECGNPSTHRRVVLAPVAVLSSPPLVDAALRNVAAQFALVMEHSHLREVANLPAGAVETQAEIDFLEVEEEALVEEPDFGDCLPAEHERRPHQPIDSTRLRARGLRDAGSPHRDQTEHAPRRSGKPPRGRLRPTARIDKSRAERC